jgi:hypothetical protein
MRPIETEGPRHHRPPGRCTGAAADRHQGHRRDDPHRPRPARADHRRPQDRQDQPSPSTRSSTSAGKTCTASTWPSARSESTVAQVVEKLRKHGAMEYTTVVAATAGRPGPVAVPRPLHRLRHGRVLPRHGRARADRLRRPDQAGPGLPPVVAAAAPARPAARPIPATCSTCTAACWSARPR